MRNFGEPLCGPWKIALAPETVTRVNYPKHIALNGHNQICILLVFAEWPRAVFKHYGGNNGDVRTLTF